MRLLLDTNILARATKQATGPARELLSLVAQGAHDLILSPFLLDELARVLNYPRVRALHRLADGEIAEYIEGLRQVGVLVARGPEPATVARDPDDNPIIQAAILGRADVLCTRDRHFFDPAVLAYCSERGIRIMGDLELLRLLRGEVAPPPASS